MDKLSLAFAAIERLAHKAGDDELVQYLNHSSHHGDQFSAEIDRHHVNLGDVDLFEEKHHDETHPGVSNVKTYSQAEIDAMVANAVKEAMKQRDRENR